MEYTEEEDLTVDKAVAKALEKLGITREQAEISIIDKGKKGVMGIGAKPAKVKVTRKTSATPPPPPSPAPEKSSGVQPGPEVAATPADAEKAGEILDKILKLNKMDASISSRLEGNEIWLEISGADNAILIGRKGRTIDSLQFLVNRLANPGRAPGHPRVVVDIENYRKRLMERIQHRVLEVVEEIKKTGREVELEPMNARDRRQVHLLLKDNPAVATVSRGEGEKRRVVVLPRPGYTPSDADK